MDYWIFFFALISEKHSPKDQRDSNPLTKTVPKQAKQADYLSTRRHQKLNPRRPYILLVGGGRFETSPLPFLTAVRVTQRWLTSAATAENTPCFISIQTQSVYGANALLDWDLLPCPKPWTVIRPCFATFVIAGCRRGRSVASTVVDVVRQLAAARLKTPRASSRLVVQPSTYYPGSSLLATFHVTCRGHCASNLKENKPKVMMQNTHYYV